MPRFKLSFLDRVPTRVQEMEFEADRLSDAIEIATRAEGFCCADLHQDGLPLGRLVKSGPPDRPFWRVVPR
ncbi:hypothetical protein EYB45_04955 [Erythrobacteraceae bacterium CFH 75059]|uniref:hypothetical protein n=1 Tax=Qipengyuania thermophila TaxID=2509361 RepID=UPI0010211215|nr:hypothetical protein [Qipengyuania thermophila]TCD04893.1 hypothetical protein EYB45_04955 [Erythrobacteraceae bacterium CFH 75059]